jgi:nicotinic acid mononucleotide adenylyltransferase/nicotinamide mononucleotide (NMN) deamidase PncC
MNTNPLKNRNISLHVIATGAGAGLQKDLWEVPGSSSYLSGASFPYSAEEHQEILGFVPEQYCSLEDAVDLASAAYMKAYRLNGKSPVGLGITASVASEKEHRGDHRIFACAISDDRILTCAKILDKGVGRTVRLLDGQLTDHIGMHLILQAVGFPSTLETVDATQLATKRFLGHSYFTANGQRKEKLNNVRHLALMPGTFNPPHEGHFGLADSFQDHFFKEVVFEIAVKPSQKSPLTVQDMLKRAKLLQGRHRVFTTDIPLFLDKAKTYPGMSIVMGADTLLRILDPQWGIDKHYLLNELYQLRTEIYVAERLVDGQVVTYDSIVADYFDCDDKAYKVIHNLPGRWDISSTQIRNS